MLDQRIITFRGRPLFQTARMKSPQTLNNTLEDIACFFYVLKGCGELTEGYGKHSLTRKDGLLKSCGNFISNYMRDENGDDFEAVIIYLYPDIIQEIYKDGLPNFDLANHKANAPKHIVGNELISKFIDGMFIYFDNNDLMDEDLAQLKLKELVMILLKSNYFDSVVDFFQGVFASKKSTFREIIENNVFNNLSMDQLAFLTARSLSSFKRDFKKEFGDSPARYIKSKRLEAAANKLVVSDEPVSAIAFDCGFQDVTTFSSSFRDKYALAPSQYRLVQIGK